MNRLLIVIMIVSMLFVSSCTGLNRPPKLNNPENGIVALPVKASNESSLAFGFYYKIYPETHPDLIIQIYPAEGEKFAFSSEMPPGKYSFNKIKSIFDTRAGAAKKHTTIKDISGGGITVYIKPGSVTVADKRLHIKAYNVEGSADINARQVKIFETVTEDEKQPLIEKLKSIDGIDQWQIANNTRFEN